jgi:hypothetical protein
MDVTGSAVTSSHLRDYSLLCLSLLYTVLNCLPVATDPGQHMPTVPRFPLSGRILTVGLMLSSVACSESIVSPAPVELPSPRLDPETTMATIPSVADARSRILTTLSRQELVPVLEESLVRLESFLAEGAPADLLRNQILTAAGEVNGYALLAPLWDAPDLSVIRLSLIHAGLLVGLTPLDIHSALPLDGVPEKSARHL